MVLSSNLTRNRWRWTTMANI